MKKSISLILALLMLVSVLAVFSVSAKDVETGAYFDLDVDSPENGGKVNGVELTIVTPSGSYKCTPTYSYIWYGDNNEIIAENQSLDSIPAEQLIGKTPRLDVSITSCWVDYGSGIMQKVNLSTLNKGDYYSMISTSYKGKKLSESVSWAYASKINAIVIGYKFARVLYPVENVDISIDAPKINEYPSFIANLIGNEDINGLSRLYANNVRWYDETDKVYLTMESRFKEGHSYTFIVDWELNPSAYYFPPEGFTTTVNGKTVEAVPRNVLNESYNGYAYSVSYTFPDTPASKNISSCTVSGIKAKTYNGKSQTQSVTVKEGSNTLKSGMDYTVSYKNNKNAGTATLTITGKGDYEGTIKKTFKINKAANPMTVKAKNTVSAKAKAKTTIKGAVTVSKAQGSVTYKTNNKKVTVKSGTMTVAKGLKKGKTYSVKITVTAKGNNNYKSKKVVKTIKIKVK